MLALKKKREADAKAAEEAKSKAVVESPATRCASSPESAPAVVVAANEGTVAASSVSEKKPLSLLGIDGKKLTKKSDSTKTGTKKRTPGEIRIQKDIAELDGGKVATVDFPNLNDLTTFDVIISPDSGFWKGATYHFTFNIPTHYPHTPPKVECKTKIYHPNIDQQGKVCLNILREDWKPVLDVNAVIFGLIYLFYEPNPDDPLNHEAAELFRNDVRQFERHVTKTLHSGN